jgi:hypothetical protein
MLRAPAIKKAPIAILRPNTNQNRQGKTWREKEPGSLSPPISVGALSVMSWIAAKQRKNIPAKSSNFIAPQPFDFTVEN